MATQPIPREMSKVSVIISCIILLFIWDIKGIDEFGLLGGFSIVV